ncbi:unnamed protein product [Pleuronectes platessa]|uniref:Uncharacterized protein n=1 Tax=Pleuronectes platessa TaxID=8262 RepID=A0A9N7THB2_PLEPL|nr:unnamed protein product [Pleuronectes platessa]
MPHPTDKNTLLISWSTTQASSYHSLLEDDAGRPCTAKTGRPHLADITASPSPCCQGDHNLATASWQRPAPRGIDWRDMRGQRRARQEDGGLTETMKATLT